MKSQLIVLFITWLAASLLSLNSHAADVAAGKTLATAQCANCHEPKDWQGETSSSLQSLLRDVVSGKVKHSKTPVQLTETEMADINAYWLTGKK
jgi:mono/diheme cytochrome c family protein